MTGDSLQPPKTCVVTGATSPLGIQLVDMLVPTGYSIHAISRSSPQQQLDSRCVWHKCDMANTSVLPQFSAGVLFHVASIWLLPKWIEQFHGNGIRRIIAFSSTSRFTKAYSTSATEKRVAETLARAEENVMIACERVGVACTIFRPTLIYGAGRDRNVSDIARLVKRFGIFPVLGKATGLRQPVHIADLAQACLLAAHCPASFNRSYNLSGGETLSYRQMVERVFQAMGKRPRIVSVPQSLFRLAISFARIFPKYKHLRPEMARRMDIDLCFDHLSAEHDFGYSPRPFILDLRAIDLQ